MWEWYIVYQGDEQIDVRSIERRAYAETKKRFLAANAAGSFTFGNQAVAGMWVIDRGRQQEDVVLIYGLLPQEIQMRHAARTAAGGTTMEPEIEEKIRERAYAIWKQEGRPDGKHLQHWLKAKRLVADDAALAMAKAVLAADPTSPADK
jgi:hypothetical protein